MHRQEERHAFKTTITHFDYTHFLIPGVGGSTLRSVYTVALIRGSSMNIEYTY
jgi:hypothetical protein